MFRQTITIIITITLNIKEAYYYYYYFPDYYYYYYFPITITFITSLAKEVMFLVALVCLFVCLSVNNITQKVMNGLG